MESAIEKNFFEYLANTGFPQSSVVYEPTFQSISEGIRYRPDFALIDPATKEPLAIIEIKGRNNSDALIRALHQVRAYLDALRDKAVRGYVVTPDASGAGFDFFTLDEDGRPKQVPPSVLKFESLASARLTERKEILVDEKKVATDRFFLVCNASAAFAILVAAADFILSRYGITVLTTERLALIGAAIALVVIPYVQKFKGLGIEIDRTTKYAKD